VDFDPWCGSLDVLLQVLLLRDYNALLNEQKASPAQIDGRFSDLWYHHIGDTIWCASDDDGLCV